MEKIISLLKEAIIQKSNDIPIASAIVDDNFNLISIEKNKKETLIDPTAHAEILAIRTASKTLSNWYLNNYTIITTLEPCPMCYQAILEARIKKIIYFAKDTKNGFLNGPINYYKLNSLKPKVEIKYKEIKYFSDVIKEFFKTIRMK